MLRSFVYQGLTGAWWHWGIFITRLTGKAGNFMAPLRSRELRNGFTKFKRRSTGLEKLFREPSFVDLRVTDAVKCQVKFKMVDDLSRLVLSHTKTLSKGKGNTSCLRHVWAMSEIPTCTILCLRWAYSRSFKVIRSMKCLKCQSENVGFGWRDICYRSVIF